MIKEPKAGWHPYRYNVLLTPAWEIADERFAIADPLFGLVDLRKCVCASSDTEGS
jgi:hypothetical protein